MKNILVLTFWSYQDALIQTYTLPYVRIIKKNLPENSKIFLVTFEQAHHKLTPEEKFREKKVLQNERIWWLDFNYSRFGFFASIKIVYPFLSLLFGCWHNEISAIHCWCTPAGTIGYLLSKLTGIPLIIDSYEPHAEAMVENGTWKKNSFAFKLLFYFEKKMSHRASALIAASAEMESYASEKYLLNKRKVFVKPACVDLVTFSTRVSKNQQLLNELGLTGNIVCVYSGKFGGIYLENEVFDFFKTAYEFWGDTFKILLLTDCPVKTIHSLAKKSDINIENIVVKFVKHSDVSRYMGLGDFAINPVKPVPTKKYCTSIKDGEYWAMGLPVIITKNISDDSDIIEMNNIGAVLQENTSGEYLKAIKKIDSILNSPSLQEVKQRITSIAETYRSFNMAEKIYKEIYAQKNG